MSEAIEKFKTLKAKQMLEFVLAQREKHGSTPWFDVNADISPAEKEEDKGKSKGKGKDDDDDNEEPTPDGDDDSEKPWQPPYYRPPEVPKPARCSLLWQMMGKQHQFNDEREPICCLLLQLKADPTGIMGFFQTAFSPSPVLSILVCCLCFFPFIRFVMCVSSLCLAAD